jgi:hypothetical protein
MAQQSVAFEMTDEVMTRAVQQLCMHGVREHVKLPYLFLMVLSAVVFVAASERGDWLWFLSGLPLVLCAVLAIGWTVAYVWLPLRARSRLAHLPDRTVRVSATGDSISFQTATELLKVAWSEVKSVKRVPDYWIFHLRGGARIPVPAAVVTEPMVQEWERARP